MDWQGQKLAEKLMEIFLVAFAVVAFVVGYAIGSFQTMLLTYAAGVLLTAMVTVPNWPFFNRHPLNWLDPSEVERHPKPQLTASHFSKKKTSKQKKPESPRARSRLLFEMKEGTPTRKENCNCKHSRCLKLYCECFASGVYCDGCNCANCCNNVENEATRHEAVEATLERNPNAFGPKIGYSRHSVRDSKEDASETTLVIKHNKGCHCKKSGCLNKYCECFQANILCFDYCKCVDCKNLDGNEERKAIHYGDSPGNALAYMLQTAKLH